MFLVFGMFLSVIGILFCLFVFKTRDSSGSEELVREAHSKSTTGLELNSGGFLRLRMFCKIFEFDPLFNIATLDHNVATLKEAKNPSLCHVVTLDLNVATLAYHTLEPFL